MQENLPTAESAKESNLTPAAARRRLQILLRPAGGGIRLFSTGRDSQFAFQRAWYGVDDEAGVDAAFAAELDRLAQARVAILGLPSDVGAGFRRGANLGPQALRAAWRDRVPTLQTDFARDGVVDLGDVVVVPQLLTDDMLTEDQQARTRAALHPRTDGADDDGTLPVSPLSIAEEVWRCVYAINPTIRPLTLGGDHATAWPAVVATAAARSAAAPSALPFAILQFDAHTDLLQERLGVRMCFATWSFHANELLERQRRLVQVGIRASGFNKAHWESTLDVAQFWAADVNADPGAAEDAIVAALKATGAPVFLSNDIDGTDAAFASATGTPESGGLTVDFVDGLIARVGREIGLVGGDMMEVAPLLEAEAPGRTLDTAVRYLQTTLRALVEGGPLAR